MAHHPLVVPDTLSNILVFFFGCAILFLVSTSTCPLKAGQAARNRVATEEIIFGMQAEIIGPVSIAP